MKTSAILLGITLLIATPSFATTHVVKPGENMYRIALRHGVSLSALQSANPGARAESLSIGQKLTIPSKSSTTRVSKASTSTPSRAVATGSHRVGTGDTLSKIARNRGTSVAALKAVNPGINHDALRIGQTIKVTGSGRSSAPQRIARNSSPAPVRNTRPVENISQPINHNTEANTLFSGSKTQVVTNETAKTPAVEMIGTPVTKDLAVKESTPITQNIVSQTPANTQPKASTAGNNNTTPAIENKAPEPAAEQASTTPSAYKLIKTTREQTLADVAAEHGITPEKLNSLNGWDFLPNTLLAVDSELYVPAQP